MQRLLRLTPGSGKMLPYLTENFGNPSSIHSFGRESRKWLDSTRELIAQEIGAHPNEIVLRAGNRSRQYGDSRKRAGERRSRHIITTKIEHHAVLHTCNRLEEMGFDVTYLDVDESGRISAEQVKDALRDDTILVTVMYGNNEVGTIQPIDEIGDLLRTIPRCFIQMRFKPSVFAD